LLIRISAPHHPTRLLIATAPESAVGQAGQLDRFHRNDCSRRRAVGNGRATMPGDAPKGPFVVLTRRLRLVQARSAEKTLLVKLNMGPQQRHVVPKIAVRITVTGLGGRYRADLEIGLLVRCDRRPFGSALPLGLSVFAIRVQ
jgi:hypothetical protein